MIQDSFATDPPPPSASVAMTTTTTESKASMGPGRRLRPTLAAAAARRHGPSMARLGRSISLTVADWAAGWKEAFAMFDRDSDGLAGPAELADELQRLGVQAGPAEIERFLGLWDADAKGGLSLLDFTSFMSTSRASSPNPISSSHQQRESTLELRAAFDLFDTDKDGALSRQEVAAALALIGEEATESDLDGIVGTSGALSFREFRDLLLAPDADADRFPGKSQFKVARKSTIE